PRLPSEALPRHSRQPLGAVIVLPRIQIGQILLLRAALGILVLADHGARGRPVVAGPEVHMLLALEDEMEVGARFTVDSSRGPAVATEEDLRLHSALRQAPFGKPGLQGDDERAEQRPVVDLDGPGPGEDVSPLRLPK